jgi:CBS domain-containing protein
MFRVKDILHFKGNDIWFLAPDAPVIDALNKMKEHDVGALLVMENAHLVGIVSERDFVRSIADEGQCYFYKPISEYMTREVITVEAEATLDDCMQAMTQHRIRHLPVVTPNGALLGVISIGDVMKQVISQKDSTISALENYIEGRGYAR